MFLKPIGGVPLVIVIVIVNGSHEDRIFLKFISKPIGGVPL